MTRRSKRLFVYFSLVHLFWVCFVKVIRGKTKTNKQTKHHLCSELMPAQNKISKRNLTSSYYYAMIKSLKKIIGYRFGGFVLIWFKAVCCFCFVSSILLVLCNQCGMCGLPTAHLLGAAAQQNRRCYSKACLNLISLS